MRRRCLTLQHLAANIAYYQSERIIDEAFSYDEVAAFLRGLKGEGVDLEDKGGTAPVDTTIAPAQTEDPNVSRPSTSGQPDRDGSATPRGLSSSRPGSRENEPSRYVRRKPGEANADVSRRRDAFRHRSARHAAGGADEEDLGTVMSTSLA